MSATHQNDITHVNTLAEPSYRLAWRDLMAAGQDSRRWMSFAFLHIKRTYWRTRLGLVWLPLSFMIFVVGLSLLWANIIGRDLGFYLPYMGYGFACFGFISATISGGEQVFTANANVIREFPLPLSFYAYAKAARDLMTLGFSLGVMLLLDVVYMHAINVNSLLALPGLALYGITGVLASLLIGMITTRFRDIGQLIPTIMRAAFFFTPIIWVPSESGGRAALAQLNPLYHYIEIVRAPMSGNLPDLLHWYVASGCTLSIFVLVLLLYKVGTRRIRIWL